MLVVFTRHYHKGSWMEELWDSVVVSSPPLKPHRWGGLCHRILTPISPSRNQSFLSPCLSSHIPSPAGQAAVWHAIPQRWGRRWDATLVLRDISAGRSQFLVTGWYFGPSSVSLQSRTLICCHFRQILQGSSNTVSNILLQRLLHIFCPCCSVTRCATWQAADSSREH